ncbi:hypothetical protein [Kribbella sp. NPDC050459]|uniref:hypothetical protein n=1 Tax=Kribbella sp. NPDC050459 TaxID=3155785 RepID=UPI0033F5137C
MSSIVPGPQKKIGEEIDAARSGAKPLNAGDLNASAPRVEELTGLDDWPETLRAAVEAEYARVTALESNRRKTADSAVGELVAALDTLLSEITDHLQAGKPRLFGKTTPPEPSPEAAALLGIPSDDLTPPPHRTAVRTLKQLRTQLKDLEATPDHARLTRLTTFTIRLAMVLDAAPDSAPALAPIALARYTQGLPDPQWTATFPEKLTTWQNIRHTLTTP